MLITQASAILNAIYGALVGETAILAADMSNIVDFGRALSTTSAFGDDLNKYTKTMWDKVGETIYANGEYRGSAPDIYATDAEFGSALEKIRIIPGDYENNLAWNFTEGGGSSHSDMFGYHPAEVVAKYYNSKAVYRTEPVTITDKQLASAFQSPLEMMRFIAHLEQAYISKMRMAFDTLIMGTINTYIAAKINAKNGVVNLLTEYKNISGNTTLTAATARYDRDFLMFAAAEIQMYRDYIKEPNAIYNIGGYVGFTRKEDIKTVLLSSFARAIETHVYSTTYHNEYIKLDNYDIVGRWQGIGTSGTYEDRSSINIKIKDPSDATKSVTVNQSNIVGVIFNKAACMINAYKTETGVAHNDFDKWNNYIWQQEAGHFVDIDENGVVFIIEDVAAPPTT